MNEKSIKVGGAVIHIFAMLGYARLTDMQIRKRAKYWGHPKSVQNAIINWVHEFKNKQK